MTTDGRVTRASFAEAADDLAVRVLDALDGADPGTLADHVDSCADLTTALGAVRLVGADVFAPHLLLDRPLDVRDVAVVTESFTHYPALGDAHTREQGVTAWRDWATLTALSLLTGPDGEVVTTPPPHDVSTVLGPVERWQQWSVHVAQLHPLALPGLDGPVADAVGREPRALVRGAV
ncbi:hypothetical protein AB0G02_37930, partial [Actinosynnema sp. NPDC023658]|uniref:hypothetical protein n=1 Tax=Actinosynnema sp. NPDC023658 TaxID=3155465 RepID=UPI0033DAC654